MVEKTMRVLALDTSSDMLCCAVGEWQHDGDTYVLNLLAERDHLCRRHANEELASCILEVLEQAGLSVDQLDCVLVGRGPGSFTGVRIGISCAKGFSSALGLPLYAVSTLDGAAWNIWHLGIRGKLGLAADAMRKEVYPAIFELAEAGPVRCFASETVVKADSCVSEWQLRIDAAELQLAGDGMVKYRDLFEEAGLHSFLEEELWYVRGRGLLLAGLHAWEQGDLGSGDPALVLPVYTRLSDAEEAERERLGKGEAGFVNPSGVAEEQAGIHLQLRPMSVNDIAEAVALDEQASADEPSRPWTYDMFYEEMHQPKSSWWVAHDQGKVVGFAGAQLAGDTLDIMDVVVSPERRREHIATRLLERVCYDGHMLGAASSTLEVYAQNTAALSLYQQLGYEQVGLRRDYYGKGNDARILTVALPLELSAPLADEGLRQERVWSLVHAERSAGETSTIQAAAPLILALESSCDETAMALIDGSGRVLSSVVATQIDFHARFGGVVPEIASRKHTEALVAVFEEALSRAARQLGVDYLEPADLSAVGVTAGPGLVGALVVGVAFAKGLSAGLGIPLIACNHLEGHLLSNLFETPDLEPPFVASLVSGGNTMLVHVRRWGDYELLGATIDDAVGEAFDKVAKALGLGYPGGPAISRLAATGNPRAIRFPRAMMRSGDYRFSLSGLKTAVITYIEEQKRAGRTINLPDLAASFEAAVVDVQVAKAARAVEELGVSDFCVGGGVAANPALRAAYLETFGKQGVRVPVPPLSVCGDNAAMIALAALRSYRAAVFADLSLDAQPNAALDQWTCKETPLVALNHADI